MEDLPNLQDSAINFPGFQHHKPQTVLKPCPFIHLSSRNAQKQGLYTRFPAQTGDGDFGTGHVGVLCIT